MIEPVVAVTVGLGLLAFQRWDAWKRWSQAAQKLDMGLDWRWLGSAEIRGLRHGFRVRIHKDNKALVAAVDGRGRIPDNVKLGAENLFTRTFAPDILTGDARFDHEARILGAEVEALAVLDHQTRALVRQVVVEAAGIVERGRVTSKGTNVDSVAVTVPGMVELARRLVLRAPEIPERLASIVSSDPQAPVRLRCLRTLHERFPANDETRAADLTALTSPHVELRLEAAVHLGDDGIEALCEIAAEEKASQDLRVRAVQNLNHSSWKDQAAPVLERLLWSDSARLRREAVVGLGRFRHRPAAEALHQLADTAAGPTAEAIAKALARIGVPESEPCLINLLSHGDTRVRTAAAKALGEAGTVAAVEPLLDLTRGFTSGGLKRVAREAIQRIQGRVAGGEHGQLSLTAPADQEGALSQADDVEEAGALSMGPEEVEG